MLTHTYSIRLNGLEPLPLMVECEVSKGIGIHLIGLADFAVKECLLRTVTALQAHQYYIPGKKIVVNIAPADLYKSGTGYDLAVAVAMIAASEQEQLPDLDKWVLLGEVALDGSLRDVPGALQAMLAVKDGGFKGCIIPEACKGEVLSTFWEGMPVYLAKDIKETLEIIKHPENAVKACDAYSPEKKDDTAPKAWTLLSVNNSAARRAAEIAAAGGHNILLMGGDENQKAAAARLISELLPAPDTRISLVTAKALSVLGTYTCLPYAGVPFRAPSNYCSLAAMLGGGAGDNIRPGEVTLASGGVLYLDDLPEMPKSMVEALRGPLEDKKVVMSRLRQKVEYPTDFLLAVGTKPCPCGNYGEGDKCTCTRGQRSAYLSKLSGPVFDRLAMQVFLRRGRFPADETYLERFENVKARVEAARAAQKERYASQTYKLNNDVPAAEIIRYCGIEDGSEEQKFLDLIIEKIGLSARVYSPAFRIARTIADLAGEKKVRTSHIAEAITYRFLDRLDGVLKPQ